MLWILSATKINQEGKVDTDFCESRWFNVPFQQHQAKQKYETQGFLTHQMSICGVFFVKRSELIHI